MAVRIVTTNKGKKTPGIDGKLINNDEEKCKVVDNLKWWIQNPTEYKAKPLKRVYIPKSKNKLRPLGIPTIEERCLQALLNLVLEPLVECTSDTHSYGFRKFRSAKMALGALRVNLRSNPDHYDKYILDADIQGFFDNISHEWLIKSVPLEITLKIILDKWLKAGSIYLTKFEPTEMGTPQGGIISPCLANFTLNGLQGYVEKKVKKGYKGFKGNQFNVKKRIGGKIK
jgi:RNA-directed DNA polymerase